jgi:Mesyanzhinovviridae bifunctional DNA primase/polymerase
MVRNSDRGRSTYVTFGAEEAFFAGNHELNDQLKHLLTGDEIEVEQKFGQRISIKSMHRLIMTSNHDQVIAASDDERRFSVFDVSEARRGDHAYFAPLGRAAKGEDVQMLAAFLHALLTRDIGNWHPEAAARAASSADLARQKLLSPEPPLQWLLEEVQSSTDAASTAGGTGRGRTWELEQNRSYLLRDYRDWAKNAQVRGATEFTGAEMFWASIKRLLNDEIFPGQILFRSSGGIRYVLFPSRREMLKGFNRLLGAKVVDEQP